MIEHCIGLLVSTSRRAALRIHYLLRHADRRAQPIGKAQPLDSRLQTVVCHLDADGFDWGHFAPTSGREPGLRVCAEPRPTAVDSHRWLAQLPLDHLGSLDDASTECR